MLNTVGTVIVFDLFSCENTLIESNACSLDRQRFILRCYSDIKFKMKQVKISKKIGCLDIKFYVFNSFF